MNAVAYTNPSRCSPFTSTRRAFLQIANVSGPVSVAEERRQRVTLDDAAADLELEGGSRPVSVSSVPAPSPGRPRRSAASTCVAANCHRRSCPRRAPRMPNLQIGERSRQMLPVDERVAAVLVHTGTSGRTAQRQRRHRGGGSESNTPSSCRTLAGPAADFAVDSRPYRNNHEHEVAGRLATPGPPVQRTVRVAPPPINWTCTSLRRQHRPGVNRPCAIDTP